MTRVAIKGITSRRLRTVLTALAIVLGVAMVSGAYTLTDTMRGAADSLSEASYDGTAAVVSAKTAFEPGMDSFAQKPTIPASALDEVRGTTGVDVAVGDISDTAQIMGSGPRFVWLWMAQGNSLMAGNSFSSLSFRRARNAKNPPR